jgi:hypothetical protein
MCGIDVFGRWLNGMGNWSPVPCPPEKYSRLPLARPSKRLMQSMIDGTMLPQSVAEAIWNYGWTGDSSHGSTNPTYLPTISAARPS